MYNMVNKKRNMETDAEIPDLMETESAEPYMIWMPFTNGLDSEPV